MSGAIRPILFSAPMVRAILAEVASPGSGKTQTRRLIKPQPFIDAQRNFCTPRKDGSHWNWGQHFDGRPCLRNYIETLPFAVGDRLWVRETWRLTHVGGGRGGGVAPFNAYEMERRADDKSDYFEVEGDDDPHLRFASDHWKPGIHMPRWASRLTLEVTNVRVERLQDISEADAIAEGVDTVSMADVPRQAAWNRRHDFSRLWDSINADRAPWSSNPWVVAVTFKPHLVNVDAFAAQRAKETA